MSDDATQNTTKGTLQAPQRAPGFGSLVRELIGLYVTFFKIGCVTFGGGLAMLPILERTLVNQKGWVTMDEILDYYSIAQMTPGIIAVNVSTFVGYKRAGVAGGIIATLGMVTPSVIIITIIAKFISNFEHIEAVQRAMRGINAAVSALLFYSVWGLCRKNVKNALSLALFCLSFIALYFFHAHTVLIILAAAVVGVVSYVITTKRGAK